MQLPRTLMGLLGHHQKPVDDPATKDMPPGLHGKSIRNGILRLVLFAAVVILVIILIPGLGSIRSRLEHGLPVWIAAAAALRLASALSYVVLFRAIFAPSMERKLAYRIAMTEIGLNALVPAGGTGGLAVGGWVLHRQGMKTEDVVSRSAELFVFTSAFNVGAVAVLGWLGAVGAISTHAALVFSLVPAIAASAVITLAVLAAPRLTRLRARQSGLKHVKGARWWMLELLVMLGTGAGGALGLFRSRNPRAILGGTGYLLFDIATLWAAVRAFHGHPAIGALALAYLIGQLAGEIPIPGGLGAVDGGLIGTMVLFGLPVSVATAAALAYRAIALGIPTVFGGLAAVGLTREIRRWGPGTAPAELGVPPGVDLGAPGG